MLFSSENDCGCHLSVLLPCPVPFQKLPVPDFALHDHASPSHRAALSRRASPLWILPGDSIAMAPRTRVWLPLLLCLVLRATAALAQEEDPATEPVATEPVVTDAPADVPPDTMADATQTEPNATPPPSAAPAEPEEYEWGLNSIRDSFQVVNTYFDSLVEMMGGRNGVCQYRCRYGKAPHSRPNYKTPEPNGCSSGLLGFQVPQSLDMGIPAMTKCCNQLDLCYDTCGSNKYRCDSKFRWCLHSICSDLKRSLGFVSKVEACESVADTLYNTVWTLGCRSYMNSQRAACFCEGEEKDEL
ncbi:hypothetical protein AAFF_G00137600 [Aldrovandia affinis]|uniref:Group XIIB secretory phospholipase A2-like protein n=1 Tax=Aldrovandia affinis TaxID=143900 RepID=A0AAD7TBS4_9TELE|nr:hypothetical protein AAFF_G00137600 [Aldrovandia affinis]